MTALAAIVISLNDTLAPVATSWPILTPDELERYRDD